MEGKRDKVFFGYLRSEVEGPDRDVSRTNSRTKITITTAESIKSEGPAEGNRDKVEKVCQLVEKQPFSSKFVGFVDREFRNFAVRDEIEDSLGAQNLLNRLVWSRGHSIENYLFNFETVRRPLRICTPDPMVSQRAMDILRENFRELINVACALGLAAREVGEMEFVRSTVTWPMVTISGSKFQWDTDKWRLKLQQHSKFDAQVVDSVVQNFETFLTIAQSSNEANVRWACDGHLGYRLIWQGYASIVNHVCLSNEDTKPMAPTQRSAVLGVKDDIKFNHLVDSWTNGINKAPEETPLVCFAMVGAAT